MTKDEARKELLETLEEYCHEHGYGLQTFAGLSDLVYTLYPLRKHMTNAEYIRNMSDEKLASWLWNHNNWQQYCRDICPRKADCRNIITSVCASGMVKWLKQEHKE